MTTRERWICLFVLTHALFAPSAFTQPGFPSNAVPRTGVVTADADSSYLSPDGSHVVATWDDRFADDHETTDRLYVYSIELKRYAAIVDLPFRLCGSADVAVANQARLIAFCQRNGADIEFWLYDTATESMRVLIAFQSDHDVFDHLQISPDGEMIAFTTTAQLDIVDTNDSEDIYIVEVATGFSRLASINGQGEAIGNITTYTLSDNSRLAFRAGPEIRVFRGHQGDSVRSFTVPNAAHNLVIARNHIAALYSLNDNDAVNLAIRNRPTRPIPKPQSFWTTCRSQDLELSGDAQFVVVQWNCRTIIGQFGEFINRSFLVDMKDDGTRTHIYSAPQSFPQMSDAGNVLMYSGKDVPWLFDRDTGVTEPLWLEPDGNGAIDGSSTDALYATMEDTP